MFHRILIPLDGSILAEQAIPHAEHFARIFGASIVLLRVLEVKSDQENQAPTDPLIWQINKAEADLYLRGIASRIRDNLQVHEKNSGDDTANNDRVEYTIRAGRTADNIIDFAHTENIDLLVISSHGSGGLSRWNMSSVIEKVIDLIYLPLLIVRSNDQQTQNDNQIHYRHILIPVDSSTRAECALPAGILLTHGEGLLERALVANPLDSDQPSPVPPSPVVDSSEPKLFLAAVMKPPEIPIPKPYPIEVRNLSEQLSQVSLQAVHTYLNNIKLRLPVETEIRVVESSKVSSAVQDVANQEDIDLIILSAHGNTDQFTHPYGNVTRNIMEYSTKSILVIQDMPYHREHSTAAVTAEETYRGHYTVQEDGTKSTHELLLTKRSPTGEALPGAVREPDKTPVEQQKSSRLVKGNP